MEVLNQTAGAEQGRNTFFAHVFDMSQEANGEVMNVTQYALLGIIPVLVLNKLIQRFSPEADPDSSSVELLVEILLQTIAMFVGIIFIHRIITYLPTYSGFKYEHLTLTNVILAFLMVVLSLQTKLGIKVNILYDRVLDLWNGSSSSDNKKSNMKAKARVRVSEPMVNHSPSQADFLDGVPPPPVVQSKQPANSFDYMINSVAPANSMVGGGFGSFF